MPKTQFNIGDKWPSAFANSIYGATAADGHLHDGGDADGHAQKVRLASDVSGVLPLANVANHVHDGSSRAKIHPFSHVEGVSEGGFNIVFPNTQFTTEQTVPARYRLEQPIDAGTPAVVRLVIKRLQAESNSMTLDCGTQPLPEAIRPIVTTVLPVIVQTTGVDQNGMIIISNAGNITFAVAKVVGATVTYDSAAFANSGAKGFTDLVLHYSLWT